MTLYNNSSISTTNAFQNNYIPHGAPTPATFTTASTAQYKHKVIKKAKKNDLATTATDTLTQLSDSLSSWAWGNSKPAKPVETAKEVMIKKVQKADTERAKEIFEEKLNIALDKAINPWNDHSAILIAEAIKDDFDMYPDFSEILEENLDDSEYDEVLDALDFAVSLSDAIDHVKEPWNSTTAQFIADMIDMNLDRNLLQAWPTLEKQLDQDKCDEILQALVEKEPVDNDNNDIRSMPMFKKAVFETTLAYTQWSSNDNDWWNKIDPYPIILGGLPLKNEGHVNKIKAAGATSVLSMVEDHEHEEGKLVTPAVKKDWQEKNIKFFRVPTPDFHGIRPRRFRIAVILLTLLVRRGETVYVHCKAGKGRSAAVVIGYLIDEVGLSYKQSHSLVKERRPKININERQENAILNGVKRKDVENDPDDEDEMPDLVHESSSSNDLVSEDHMTYLLSFTLKGVTDGGWIFESVETKRNRLLKESGGDQDKAVKKAIKESRKDQQRLFSWSTAGDVLNPSANSAINLIKRGTNTAINTVPVVGTSKTLWHQLREITVIAAIYGHDVNDPEVQKAILVSLVDGDINKIPSVATDIVARYVIKEVVARSGVPYVQSLLPDGRVLNYVADKVLDKAPTVAAKLMPKHKIFNYLTDNSAKVSTYAIKHFGGKNAKRVPPEDYMK